jgi:hypothetical protein
MGFLRWYYLILLVVDNHLGLQSPTKSHVPRILESRYWKLLVSRVISRPGFDLPQFPLVLLSSKSNSKKKLEGTNIFLKLKRKTLPLPTPEIVHLELFILLILCVMYQHFMINYNSNLVSLCVCHFFGFSNRFGKFGRLFADKKPMQTTVLN